jgi:hypothetical protein
MPEYTVKIVHTVRIVGTVQVTAETADDAAEALGLRAAQGELGSVQWSIENDQSGVDEWYEEEVQLAIEDIEEEPA